LIALAVNEENASGGRVVTAPTNGAAGIIPAVLYYALHFAPGMENATQEDRDDVVVKFPARCRRRGGALQGAGVHFRCRGGLPGRGGLGIVHGRCWPGRGDGRNPGTGGERRRDRDGAQPGPDLRSDRRLVQVPCIERNAIAAAKAINAAKMALWGDGSHRVSLDEVIVTMRETGKDMSSKYKETAMGGLAVNVSVC
jgi:L-serine dehydratase